MTVRISTALFYQNGLNGILNQQSKVSTLQNELSAGQRVLTPADDPLASAQSVIISQSASMNTTYASNRATANQSLGSEENALSSVTTTLQSVLTQIVQAGDGAMSDADRQAMVTQLTSARDQLLGLANSTDGNGQYLFSGYKGFTQPYTTVTDSSGQSQIVYQGDTGQRTIQVEQTRQMASSDVGTDIFNRVSPGTISYITTASGNAAGGANQGTGTFSATSVSAPSATNYVGDTFKINFTQDNSDGPGTGNVTYSVAVTDAKGNPVTDISGNPVILYPDTYKGVAASTNVSGATATVATSGTVGTSTATTNPPATAYTYKVSVTSSGYDSSGNPIYQYSAQGVDISGAPVGTATTPATFTPGEPITLDNGTTFSIDNLPTTAADYANTFGSNPVAENFTITPSFSSGDTIDMNGVSLSIAGTPAAGDSFTVAPPQDGVGGNVDMFKALNDLITTLSQPAQNNEVTTSAISNALSTANKQINLVLNNVLTVRSSVGSRMNELTALDDTGTQKDLSYTSQLTDLKGANMNDLYSITSDLQLRQVSLQAALQSFTLIQGSSLFSLNK
jgi:flagellar hook-associated protein 3 FlgL